VTQNVPLLSFYIAILSTSNDGFVVKINRSRHGLISRYYIDIFLGLRKTTKTSVRIASLWAEIWTRNLLNKEQECSQLGHDVRYYVCPFYFIFDEINSLSLFWDMVYCWKGLLITRCLEKCNDAYEAPFVMDWSTGARFPAEWVKGFPFHHRAPTGSEHHSDSRISTTDCLSGDRAVTASCSPFTSV
jgi:hypothetical protein